MLKRLSGVSSKLAQNKLFLPDFPATSLLFLFFSSPQQLTETLSLSPHLNQRRSFPLLPGQRQTRDLIIFLFSLPAGLTFFFPSAASNKGQPPLLQSQTGAALSLSSHSLPAAPTLSPLPLINTKPAADLPSLISLSAKTLSSNRSSPQLLLHRSSSAATASTGTILRLPASSPANSSPPSSSDAQQQPK